MIEYFLEQDYLCSLDIPISAVEQLVRSPARVAAGFHALGRLSKERRRLGRVPVGQ